MVDGMRDHHRCNDGERNDCQLEVSIIVPTLNEAQNIGRLLASIQRQEGVLSEVIVVDQDSNDHTVAIAESFGARVVRVERSPYYRPPSQSRNIGAASSTAPIITHLDADMELGDQFLLRNAVDLIGSNTQAVVLHERDVPTGFWSGVKAFEREFYVGRPIEAARLVTRRLFELVGGYDEEISSGEDFDLHDRYGAATQIVACDDGLILHHTGHSTLRSLLRKKYSYGRAAQGYLTKATSRSIPTLLNVQMRAFFARPRDAATHPAKYGALWLLRALEACALFAGLIRSAISS